RLEHRIGLLRGGGAIEVDQRLLARPAENREIGANGARVEGARGDRGRSACGCGCHESYPILRWMTCRSCSRTLSSGMRSSTGAKKPSTISRCAWERGSPRAIK